MHIIDRLLLLALSLILLLDLDHIVTTFLGAPL